MNSVQIHGELLLLRERLRNQLWPPGESIKAVTVACGDIDYLLLIMEKNATTTQTCEEATETINLVYQQLDGLHQNYDLIYTHSEGPLTEIINHLLLAIDRLLGTYTQ
jgi:hypothetical protein